MRKWWTLLVVCAATFMLLLDVTIVLVALPDIQHALDMSFSDLQWVTDAYALALAALLLTAGSLADRYGRRRLFLFGLAIFTAGSALCGTAQDPLMLVISRALQGVGGAILYATSLALLASTFHGKERGVAFGVWGAVTGVATALGPILGGAITSGISWRGIFWVNVPIGVAAIAVTLWQVAESRTPHPHRPDWAGFGTLTAALVALVYGLIRASEISWHDGGVIICLCLAAVFLAAFAAVETRVRAPMFSLSLLRIPTFLGGSIAAFAMNASLFAMFLYLVLYLQDDLGYSALATGIRLLISSGTTMVAATIAGRLSSHLPTRWLIGPGLVLVGAGLLLMTGLDAGTGWTHLIPGFIVAGAGSGLVNPPLASTAVGVVPVHRSGMASGVNTTFRQIGIAVGIAAYGSIFTATLGRSLAQHLSQVPSLAGHSGQITGTVSRGSPAQAITAAPAPLRGQLTGAIHASFAAAMNDLLITSGILALAGGVLAFALIRRKDFVASHPEAPPVAAAEPAVAAAEPATAADPASAARGRVRRMDGSGIGGAALTLVDRSGRQAGRGSSGSDGGFTIGAPGPGSYVLIASAGSYRPEAITVLVGTHTAGMEIVLTGTAGLSGVVTTLGSGEAIIGATTTLTDTRGEVTGSARTDSDGRYEFRDLAAGSYTLAVSAPSYQPKALAVHVPGTGTVQQDMALSDSATVQGLARAGHDGHPVGDARITLLDAAGNVVGVTHTDDQGRYCLSGLAGGDYTVIAAGYPPVASALRVSGGEQGPHDVRLSHPGPTTAG
jgi:EmrB/QacA subfamily drug resistance transporter